MISLGCCKVSLDPLDYELADITSVDHSRALWISSNYKTYKYIIPYRFFNPEDMDESLRFILKLVNGKPKLCS